MTKVIKSATVSKPSAPRKATNRTRTREGNVRAAKAPEPTTNQRMPVDPGPKQDVPPDPIPGPVPRPEVETRDRPPANADDRFMGEPPATFDPVARAEKLPAAPDPDAKPGEPDPAAVALHPTDDQSAALVSAAPLDLDGKEAKATRKAVDRLIEDGVLVKYVETHANPDHVNSLYVLKV